ncbi:endonuclease [Falsiporphyromonas endometrii]|uniref:Endonuclease n=1 Tax=Falsiporphyromonas endometrii TaxID=1387297 RepID=A0ABV9K9I8_9PORP
MFYRKIVLFLSSLFLLSAFNAYSQTFHRIVFWNVENLFDTVHDDGKEDYDFLPDGKNRWTKHRYRRKIADLTAAICRAGGKDWPVMIGLAEVENDNVLKDLVHHHHIKDQDYQFLSTHSPDVRGIDVALLYQVDFFKPIHKQEFEIENPKGTTFKTRNILYVCGQLPHKEKLHCFVCHFPSKRGGAEQSSKRRQIVAKTLSNKIDSIRSVETRPYIMIMGDFNCEPEELSNPSMLQISSIGDKTMDETALINLFEKHKTFEIPGSHVFQRIWNQLDQIIVTKNCLEGKHFKVIPESAQNIQLPGAIIQSEDMKGGIKPFSTFRGPIYKGGVSDHLPIKIDVIIQ